MGKCLDHKFMGLMPVLNVLNSELFPTEIRATSNGIGGATCYVILMGNYKLYPIAMETFGFHFVVYFYAAVTALFTIWGLLTIKNTDRLSLTEIQDMHMETAVAVCEKRNGAQERTQETSERV